MGIINDFNDTLKASINTNNNIVHTEKRQDKKLYYTEEYRNAIFRNDNYKNALEGSLEMKKTKYGTYPICAWASSARLCFLDFYNIDGNLEFEKALKNDIGATTKIDVFDSTINTYYECKCQEILSSSIEHIRFSKTYLEKSNLFKEMGLEGEEKEDKYFVLNVDKICKGLNPKGKSKSLYFDVKQMICHLIALAKVDCEKTKKLQYVIYKPSFDEKKYNALSKVYSDIIKEYELLRKRFLKFAECYNINIAEKIVFKNICNIKDYIYEKVFEE